MTNARHGLERGDITEYIRLVERLYGVSVWYTLEYISNNWVAAMIDMHERVRPTTLADQIGDIVDTYEKFGPYIRGDIRAGIYTPIAVLQGTNIYLSGMRIFPRVIMDDMLVLCISSLIIVAGVYLYGAARYGITKVLTKAK